MISRIRLRHKKRIIRRANFLLRQFGCKNYTFISELGFRACSCPICTNGQKYNRRKVKRLEKVLIEDELDAISAN